VRITCSTEAVYSDSALHHWYNHCSNRSNPAGHRVHTYNPSTQRKSQENLKFHPFLKKKKNFLGGQSSLGGESQQGSDSSPLLCLLRGSPHGRC
jgi:hypothetical protein